MADTGSRLVRSRGKASFPESERGFAIFPTELSPDGKRLSVSVLSIGRICSTSGSSTLPEVFPPDLRSEARPQAPMRSGRRTGSTSRSLKRGITRFGSTRSCLMGAALRSLSNTWGARPPGRASSATGRAMGNGSCFNARKSPPVAISLAVVHRARRRGPPIHPNQSQRRHAADFLRTANGSPLPPTATDATRSMSRLSLKAQNGRFRKTEASNPGGGVTARSCSTAISLEVWWQSTSARERLWRRALPRRYSRRRGTALTKVTSINYAVTQDGQKFIVLTDVRNQSAEPLTAVLDVPP